MPTLTIRTDAHGNPVSGSQAAVERYDAAIDHLLAYRNEFVDAMTSLVDDEPDFAMGLVLAAYLSLTSTDVPDVAGARQLAGQLDTLTLNDRRPPTATPSALAGGRLARHRSPARHTPRPVARRPARPARRPPTRLLPRRRGQPPRPGRTLPAAIDPAHPHHGYVRGCTLRARGVRELPVRRTSRTRRRRHQP